MTSPPAREQVGALPPSSRAREIGQMVSQTRSNRIDTCQMSKSSSDQDARKIDGSKIILPPLSSIEHFAGTHNGVPPTNNPFSHPFPASSSQTAPYPYSSYQEPRSISLRQRISPPSVDRTLFHREEEYAEIDKKRELLREGRGWILTMLEDVSLMLKQLDQRDARIGHDRK